MGIDVLIVGAGPVGMTLASELRRYGLSVRIIEQVVREPTKTRAMFLWSRTLELFDRLGNTSAFIAAGQKLTAANIVAEGRSIGRIDFSEVDSSHPYMLTLPQVEMERGAEGHLNKLGVQIERNTGLIALNHLGSDRQPTGLRVVISKPDGGQETLETKWLVGCDGMNSTVRRLAEMPLIGDGRQSDWIVGDVHLTGMGLNPSEFTIYWHEKGALAIFPIQGGGYRVVADMGNGVGMPPAGNPSLAELQALLDERGPGGLQAADPIWLVSFRVSNRKVRDYGIGRVFLAGDAAHMHNPIGAQSINMGIQDAVNLAWKLALVERGVCAESRLMPSYSAERAAVADEVTVTLSRLTRAANMRNQPFQMVRNLLGGALLGLSPVRRTVAGTLAEISLGYAHSPLNGPEERALPGPGPGDRMPPVAGVAPVGGGDTPRFALFADASPDVDALLAKHADLLEPGLRPPVSPRCIWLVRPDGYVAAASPDLDVRVIADYLDWLKEK